MLNVLERVLSTLYLTMKYPLDNGQVGVANGDEKIAMKYFQDSFRIKKDGNGFQPSTEAKCT